MREDIENRYILSSDVEFSRRKVAPVTRPKDEAIPDAMLKSTKSSGEVVL
jgi:hypothetical protein